MTDYGTDLCTHILLSVNLNHKVQFSEFEMLRMPYHMSNAMFQNQASGATFQNLPPDAIFCACASDVYYEWHSLLYWRIDSIDVRT